MFPPFSELCWLSLLWMVLRLLQLGGLCSVAPSLLHVSSEKPYVGEKRKACQCRWDTWNCWIYFFCWSQPAICLVHKTISRMKTGTIHFYLLEKDFWSCPAIMLSGISQDDHKKPTFAPDEQITELPSTAEPSWHSHYSFPSSCLLAPSEVVLFLAFITQS